MDCQSVAAVELIELKQSCDVVAVWVRYKNVFYFARFLKQRTDHPITTVKKDAVLFDENPCRKERGRVSSDRN